MLRVVDIIDTHEHLPNKEDRIKGKVDFNKRYSLYCTNDLLAARMKPKSLEKLLDETTDIEINKCMSL